jgi:glucose dehydrogenase
MSESTVAIVGSGIAGTAMAYLLTRKGYDVVIFEKGPAYPYPHYPQFRERIHYLYENPAYLLPPDLKNLTFSGDPYLLPDDERYMVVGGTATHWGAAALRMVPRDFDTRSRYGYGDNWPLTYDELEPWYSAAEWFLGVSGTDADNPFAPRRSRPFPLPPFALSYNDRQLAAQLREHGIVMHSTPQARTRLPYEQRPGCMNFGTCDFCPIGVRYSPNYHLDQAVATGRCTVHANTSVKRIVMDKSNRARALVYQPNDAATEMEHGAKLIIVAAGTIESARLLLLSSRDRHPDGLPRTDHVGQHFIFHHAWTGRWRPKEEQWPGSVGAHTGSSYQFRDPPTSGKHGGVIVELSNAMTIYPELQSGFTMRPVEDKTPAEIVGLVKEMRRWRTIDLQGESIPTAKKHVTLSERRDRFGDPYAHLHYEAADFDHEAYRYVQQLFDKLVVAAGGNDAHLDAEILYSTQAHHMGGCRMGADARDSVVDRFGKVHGTLNLFVVGGSNFVSTSASHPTLTIVALAMRAAGFMIDHVL